MMLFHTVILLLPLLVHGTSEKAKFSEYILAPSSRTVKPVSIHQVVGSVKHPEALLANAIRNAKTSFEGPTAYVTYDFGKNVGGWVHFEIDKLDSLNAKEITLTVTFTESSLYISSNASDGIGDSVGNVS